MSIILKALRKSEQDRLSQPMKVLDDKIAERAAQKPRKGAYWFVLLVFMNMLLLIFLGWESLQGDNEDSVVEQGASDYFMDSELARVPTKTAAVNEPDVSIAQQVETKEVKKLKAQQLKVSVAKKLVITKQVAKVKEGQKDKPVPQKQTQKLELNLSEEDSDLPYLSEMPYDFRQSVPVFNINAFVYSKEPEARFIIVNMRKYTAGETLNEGLVLQEIRSEGIVVEYEEETFLIQR